MKRMRPHHRREGGYMLLTVLFMAALVIITLGMSLPREAFEGQRQREEELVYRGGQYSRAVQLYFRKFKRYPSDLDNLEKSNNVRFLRRKYVDPITKESEWRIIHVGPGGTFTDSLVYDRPKPQTKDGMTPAGTPETPGGPQSEIPGQPQITGMADRLRALGAGQTATPDQPGGADPNNPVDPNNPQQQQPPPQQYFVAGQPGFPNQPGQPGVQAQIGAQPFQPGMPGAPPGFPAAQVQTGFGQPSGFGAQQGVGGQQGLGQQPSGNPGQQGFGGQGGFGRAPGFGQQQGAMGGQIQTPGGPAPLGSDAARLLGQLLTTPRPGGLAGIQAGMQPGGAAGAGGFGGLGQAGGGFGGMTGMAGQTGAGGAGFGGGIAGVASNSKARGIKVINEREKYNEWEFVYDYRKDPLLVGGAAAGMGGMGGQQQGAARSGAATQTGLGGTAPASSFGQSGGFGQPSGFGAPTGFGQQGGFGQPANSGFGTPGAGQPGLGQPGFGQPGFGQPTPPQPGQPGFIPPGQAPVNPSQPGLGPGLRGVPTPIITPDNPIPPPPPPVP